MARARQGWLDGAELCPAVLLGTRVVHVSSTAPGAAGRSQPSLNLSHAVAVVLAQLFEAQALQHGGVDLFEGGE